MRLCKPTDTEIKEYIKIENFYEELSPEEEEGLHQGDIFMPFYRFSKKSFLRGKSNIIGIIVVTNQCDIVNEELKYITYVPIYRTSTVIDFASSQDREEFQKIIKQNHKTIFYLPPYPSIGDELGGVVFFENIMTERTEFFLRKNESPTLRLKRPFIDRLCTKIADFFSRIPITHASTEEITKWVEENDSIKQIIDLSNLLRKVPNYFTKDDINQWAKEQRNLVECKGLMEKYLKANRLIKKNIKLNIEDIEEILSELGEMEDPNERRFVWLKNKFYINESYNKHVKAHSFIPRSDIQIWLEKGFELELALNLIEKYDQAQEFIKSKDKEKAEGIINDLREIEVLNEGRFIKLKESFSEEFKEN